MRLGIFIPVPDAILMKDDCWEKEMVRKFHMEEKMRLLTKLVQQGLFLGIVFSLLFMQTSNANATMFDLTYYDGGISTRNDIFSNGNINTPLNNNSGGNTQYFTNTSKNSYPIDATYSTNQGTITSDLSNSLIVSSANTITFNNSASIKNSFPSSLNYGVLVGMGINFNGIYTGNGSEITIPITYSANFSNGSTTVQNGTEFFFGSLSGTSNNLTNLTFTAPSNISTGTGTIADLTFQSIVGQTYVLRVSEGLSGNVLGNASADLTFLIGAPISQTPVSATPEPSTFWLMATGILGMLGLAGYRNRKMRASA